MEPKVKVKTKMPELNPFLAIPVICPTCGDIVYPEKDFQLATGKVTSLRYRHINPEYGCAWKLQHNGERSNGQILSLKDSEVAEMEQEAAEKAVQVSDITVTGGNMEIKIEGLEEAVKKAEGDNA